MTYDPFASDEIDAMENTSAAVEGFTRAKDFVGRLLFIQPTAYLTGLSSNNKPGETYDAIEANVHVLDGEPSDKFGVPSVLNAIRLSGSALVPQLRGAVAGRGFVLGRMNSAPTKFGGDSRAYFLAEPTKADWEIRDAYVAKVKAERAGAPRPAEVAPVPTPTATQPIAQPARAGGNPFQR